MARLICSCVASTGMSGCSGGVVLTMVVKKGLTRWFPVGLIYKGPDGEKKEGENNEFDIIRIRRLSFLRSDGTIIRKSQGWLPGT